MLYVHADNARNNQTQSTSLVLSQQLCIGHSRRFATVCAAKDCTVDSTQEAVYSLPRPKGARSYKGVTLLFCQLHIDKAASMYGCYKELEYDNNAPVYYRWGDMFSLYMHIINVDGRTEGAKRIRRELEAINDSITMRSHFHNFIKAAFHDEGHDYFLNTMKEKASDMAVVLAKEEEKKWITYKTRATKKKLARESRRLVELYSYRRH